MMIKPTTVSPQQVTQELKPAPRGPDVQGVAGTPQSVPGADSSAGVAASSQSSKSRAPDKNTVEPPKRQKQSVGLDPAVVDRIAKFAQSIQRDLQFSIDESVGKTVIKVVDSTTKEVIRQIPSEEALAITRHLKELGILFNSKA